MNKPTAFVLTLFGCWSPTLLVWLFTTWAGVGWMRRRANLYGGWSVFLGTYARTPPPLTRGAPGL